MNLIDYLQKFFGDMSTTSTFADLENHFLTKFGVNVKNENNLFLFKYDQIAAKWSMPLTHECRGHIVAFKDGKWSFASRPFNKFFNQHEGYCPVFSRDDFIKQLKFMCFIEKVDGTCIQLWYDEKLCNWRVSTLGTITTQGVPYFDMTLEELFRATAINIPTILLHKDNTYIFELCCEENRILTKYPDNRIYLLAIRNRNYGTYVTDEIVDAYYNDLCNNGFQNLYRPYRIYLTDLGIETFEDVEAWANEESRNEKYGQYPEGFVIYMYGKPICKMKNLTYLQLHAFASNDVKASFTKIIESVYCGTYDDIKGVLGNRQIEFAERVQEDYLEKAEKIIKTCRTIKSFAPFKSQKEYALCIQKCVDRQFHSFFFQNKEAIITDDSVAELFQGWMRKNYEKFKQEYSSEGGKD